MHDNATKFGVRREHRMHQLGAIRLKKSAAGVNNQHNLLQCIMSTFDK